MSSTKQRDAPLNSQLRSDATESTTASVAGSRRWLTVVLVLVPDMGMECTFSIITLALPELMEAFASSATVATWVVMGPMVVRSVCGPMFGTLGARHGHKRLWVIGACIGCSALLLSGCATSMAMLISGRLLQGVGQGMTMPNGYALQIAGFSDEEKPQVVGILNAGVVVGPTMGIGVGGILLQYISWRWLFLGPLPLVTACAAAACAIAPAAPAKAAEGAFDMLGTALLALGVGLLLISLTVSGFGLPIALAGLVSLVALHPVQRCAATRGIVTIIPAGIHRDVPVIAVVLANIFDSVPYFMLFITLPIYLLHVLGLNQATAGFWLIVRPAALSIGAAVAGRLCTRGWLCVPPARAEYILLYAAVLSTFSFAIQLAILPWAPSVDTALAFGPVTLTFVLQGFACGAMWTACTVLITRYAPPSQLGQFIGLFNTLAELACTFGIACGQWLLHQASAAATVDSGYKAPVQAYVLTFVVATAMRAVGVLWPVLLTWAGLESSARMAPATAEVALPTSPTADACSTSQAAMPAASHTKEEQEV